MVRQEIVYTDGRNVVVTPSELHVRRGRYKLEGILRHGMAVIQPLRLAGVFISLVGVGFLLFALQCWINRPIESNVGIAGKQLNVWDVSAGIGLLILLAGLLITVILKERYAVRIVSATGEVHVIVSHQRKYVVQIVQALNRAFRMGHHRNSRFTGTVYL